MSIVISHQKRVVLATRNPGKLREAQALLGRLGWEVLPLEKFGEVEIVEDSDSFEGNAEKKARAAMAVSKLPSVGDDSGLEVDALGGMPGVKSARFAGPDADDVANNKKLLEAMKGVREGDRSARFRCCLVWLQPDGKRIVAEGKCEGAIIREPRGTEGFGYDPLFAVGGREKTMAEISLVEKNRISHRARAFRALMEKLK